MRKLLAVLAAGAALLSLAPAARAGDDEASFDSSEWLSSHRIRLDWNQVGPVVPRGKLTLANQIRMHPPGFRADTYDLLLAPTYGFASGWEVTAGVTMAQRLGPGGTAFFYGAGLQKEIVRGEGWIPSVSLGGYGMGGPHDYFGGSLYLAATERLYDSDGLGIFLHGGARWEIFSSDDYGDANGIRPFFGVTVDYKKKYTLSGEFSPRQSFEGRSMWSVRGSVRVYKNVSISGGIRSSGYRTHPFVGIWF